VKVEARQLTVELPNDLPHIYADERSLRQILLNLLSNAIKFTGPLGKIDIGAAVTPAGEICIYVRDNGVGIAEKGLARVFENFEQGHHDTVTDDHGTGLGLPIVRGLVQAHDGRVTLESKVNEGTCVTVCFPAFRTRFQRSEMRVA